MPKKLNVSPNERIDIPDFLAGANDYTAESQKFHVERTLLDGRAQVLSGFRVEVDLLNAGVINVYNGNALDRSGQHVNDESDPETFQPVSLVDGVTSYVEIEFIEADDDTDSRAFWDPSLENVAPIPDGAEFLANVPTRITPTWRISRPVNTTAFAIDADPSSNKIPLVRLVRSGGVYVSPVPILEQPETVLLEDTLTGATQLRVATATHFSDDLTNYEITVDPAGVADVYNATLVNRVSNVLTLDITTVADYLAGTVIQASGKDASFIARRTFGVPDPTAHVDCTPRMFQGSEVRGAGFTGGDLDPASTALGERTDLEITNLKAYVDTLASQLLELKTGSNKYNVVNVAPPLAFDTANTPYHWYDRTPGILGSRTATVTVGDGIASFGDFNGTDTATIQQAVDALESGTAGTGTLFIKRGVYTLTTPVVLTKGVQVVGEGTTSTAIIGNSATEAAFEVADITAGVYRFAFSNIRFDNVGAYKTAIQITAATEYVEITSCRFTNAGILVDAASVVQHLHIRNCELRELSAFVASSQIDDLVIDGCKFYITTTAFNCVTLTDVLTAYVNNNTVISSAPLLAEATFFRMLGTASTRCQVNILNTRIDADSTAVRLFYTGGINSTHGSVTIDGVYLYGAAPHTQSFIDYNFARNFVVRNVVSNTLFQTDNTQTVCFIKYHQFEVSGAPRASTLLVDNVNLDSTTWGTFLSAGDYTDTKHAVVRDCVIRGFFYPITFGGSGTLRIRSCNIAGLVDGSYRSVHGVLVNNSVAFQQLDVVVEDTEFSYIGQTAANARVIYVVGATNSITNLVVTGCRFLAIGGPTNSVVAGIMHVGGSYNNISVTASTFLGLSSATSATLGIACSSVGGGSGTLSVCNNQFLGVGAGTPNETWVILVSTTVGDISSVQVHSNTFTGTTGLVSRAVYLTTSDVTGSISNVSIVNNHVIDTVGGTGTYGAIELQAKYLSNITVKDNTLDQQGNKYPTRTGSGTGIKLWASIEDGLFNNITVSGNQLVGTGVGNTGYRDGVAVTGALTGTDPTRVSNLTVKDNNISLGSLGTSYFVLVSVLKGSNVQVTNNHMNEEVATSARRGIYVGGAGSGINAFLENVRVNDNSAVGLDFMRTASSNCIELAYCKKFTANNNTVDWTLAADGGQSVVHNDLYFTGCSNGVVTGNTLLRRYSGGTTYNALTFDTDCTYIFAAINVIGGAAGAGGVAGHTVGDGVIALPGTPTQLDTVTAGAGMHRLNMDQA